MVIVMPPLQSYVSQVQNNSNAARRISQQGLELGLGLEPLASSRGKREVIDGWVVGGGEGGGRVMIDIGVKSEM